MQNQPITILSSHSLTFFIIINTTFLHKLYINYLFFSMQAVHNLAFVYY